MVICDSSYRKQIQPACSWPVRRTPSLYVSQEGQSRSHPWGSLLQWQLCAPDWLDRKRIRATRAGIYRALPVSWVLYTSHLLPSTSLQSGLYHDPQLLHKVVEAQRSEMTCLRSHTKKQSLITISCLTPGWFSQSLIAAVTGVQTPRCCFPAAFKRALVLPSFPLFVTRHSLPVNHRPESLILSQYAHEAMRLPRKVQKNGLAHVLCTVP